MPTHRIDQLAAPHTLTAMYLASPITLGAGLGALSAHHRGGPRPVLMAMWVSASTLVHDPWLHWPFCFALYAILMAVSAPFAPAPDPVLPFIEDAAMTLVRLGPLFAGLGYVLGVIFGRRPVVLPRTPDDAPSKSTP
jgi:hypothetical protein